MKGRAFLDLARDLVKGTSEAYWRGAIVHAYYALMLEGRETLFRWGRSLPPHQNVHSWVRLRFAYSTDADLKAVGHALDELVKVSYDPQSIRGLRLGCQGQGVIQKAADALTLLDAIDADPARRAAAITSLPP